MHALRYSVRTLISLRALRSVQACKYERNDECREKLATLESRHRGPLSAARRLPLRMNVWLHFTSGMPSPPAAAWIVDADRARQANNSSERP